MRQVRVRAAHRVPDGPPLRLAAGEAVAVRAQSGPSFAFVVGSRGSGWVPLSCLSEPYARGRRIARTGYDATELPTRAGEILRVLNEDVNSGRLWCRTRAGTEGWVPDGTIEETG